MTHQAIEQADYQQQLNAKATRLEAMISNYCDGKPELFASPPMHYRMRAEFRIWHEGDDMYCIMFDPDTRERIRIDEFPVGSELVNTLLKASVDYIKSDEALRRKLFQIEFLTTTHQQALVSLIYHRPLGEDWEAAAAELRKHLQQYATVHLIGRSRKQKIVLDQDWVLEKLTIAGRDYWFQQVENSFTQPNAAVNQHMVSWAIDATRNSSGDLLELYCGNGNFSLPMAQNFDRVLATEISKASVASARYNCELNSIENVTLVRMSAEEFSAVMAGELESRRAKEADIGSFQCHTVLVDPPRAGLDADTVELIRNYETIVYISCNPETLVENIEALNDTHAVQRYALFDQFPYTHHMEAGVILKRRPQ